MSVNERKKRVEAGLAGRKVTWLKRRVLDTWVEGGGRVSSHNTHQWDSPDGAHIEISFITLDDDTKVPVKVDLESGEGQALTEDYLRGVNLGELLESITNPSSDAP